MATVGSTESVDAEKQGSNEHVNPEKREYRPKIPIVGLDRRKSLALRSRINFSRRCLDLA